MSTYTKQVLTMIGVSMLPVIELRGAIPYGVAVGMPLWQAFLLCLLFSSIPIPLILLLLKPLLRFAKKHIKFLARFLDWFIDRCMKKSDRIAKASYVALMLFVAVPLPGTGIWTGSVIASALEMDSKKAYLAIFLGDLIAGLIVLFVSYAACTLFG